MCAPITHLLFAKKIKERYFPDVSEFEYFSGTLFPDIRHFVGLPKEDTHDLTKKISELEDLSNWAKGFWVHSVIDQVHQEYMIPTDSKVLSPKPRYFAYVLLEDQIFYPKISGIIDAEKYAGSVIEDEKVFDIKAGELKEYKSYMCEYLNKAPTFESQARFLELTVPGVRKPGVIGMIKEHFDEINNEKVNGDIMRFEQDFFSEIDSKGYY